MIHAPLPGRAGRSTAARRTKGDLEVTYISYEITAHDPPRQSSFRGINGPIRPLGTITIEPLDGGTRSKLTLELDLTGHGFGVLFAPLARSGARKDIPKSHQRLKEILERER